MRFFLLLGCCLLFGCEVRATEVRMSGVRRPRIYSSEDGARAVKVVPIQNAADKWTTTATLLDLNPDGSERKLAEWTLANIPDRVLISSYYDDFVVTLGSAMNLHTDPMIVIYDRSGHLLHSLKLDDLLAKADRNPRVSTWVNDWISEADFRFQVPSTRIEKSPPDRFTQFQFHPEKMRLNISFGWGKKISIELATGKVENAA